MTYNTKPAGYFEYLLAIDCETTGISYGLGDPSIGHQAVSWGVVVANAHTLIPIEKMYIEIKYNEESLKARESNPNFGVVAANIHGLSYEYLEENGVDEKEAVASIGSLILKYWGPSAGVNVLGHNVQSFDVPFLRAMFNRYNININLSHRSIDSNSAGFIVMESFTSDSFFDSVGMEARLTHNALDDAEMSLEACRRVRLLWDSKVGLKA